MDILENKDVFIIDKLDSVINNKIFSKMIYESNKNSYEFILDIDIVNVFMQFKNEQSAQKYMEDFMKQYPIKVNVVLNNQSDDQLNDIDLDIDSDTESDDISEEEQSDLFKLDDNGHISKLSLEGFYYYLLSVDDKYLLRGIYGKKEIYKLYIDIIHVLIETVNEIM